ncbi:type IV secretory system conjugative DNA transfer family protein, partial [Eubacterium aggregans]|uniref:type IV secretory system conjugative DNA transfer family protein n=1 Tax=Eubacterium aggregans TaxID=81409 RepID=UPI003F3508A5
MFIILWRRCVVAVRVKSGRLLMIFCTNYESSTQTIRQWRFMAFQRLPLQKRGGSFYTQAVTTLRLFTNPKIAYMTSATDFRFKAMGKDKMALFVVLPGHKYTYFRLATLLVSLCYDELSEVSDHNGGGLERHVRFILDEFGNFSAFDNLQSMETEEGGKNILLDFFIQDSAQLDMKYSKEMTQIIMSNCETWLYLKSDGQDTRELLSKKLGAYTTVAYGQNMNNQRYSTSSGQSAQLIRRELLTADEIACIERPYSLVFSRNPPVLKNAPDFSKWQFNTMLGMAGEE